MHLSGLSPFGPIFGKELRVASRRRRNYLLRVLYLLGIMLILLWAWAITRTVWGMSSLSARQQQQEQLGFFFFGFFAGFSVIAMTLIGAVLTCTAINVEREQKTLHVLLMTPLTAWQIVSGKMFSRLLTALTLLGLGLPVLALVRLLGGVELHDMFGVIAMATVMAMTSAALGLLLSIFVQRAYAVILLSYLLMGVAYVFTPMVMLIWASGSGRRGQLPWFRIISNYNPLWYTLFLASGQQRMLGVGWERCVIVHLFVTAVLLVLSALLLRRVARREGEAAAGVAAPPIAAVLPDLRPENGDLVAPPPIAPPPPRVRVTRTVSDNPVLWRELRRPLMTKSWQRIAGVVACAALMLVTYIVIGTNNDLDKSDTQVGYALVFHLVMMLLACVISATAIAMEKESDTWTILLASPVSGTNIIWSKAAGVARRLFWPVAGMALHFSFFVLGGVITPVTFLMILVVVTSFNAIWIATGVTLSLHCRKVTVAVIINLALPVVLYGVVSILLAVFDELFHVDNGHLVENVVTWYMPFYYLIEGISRNNWTHRPDLPGHGNGQVSQVEFLALAVGFGMLHLAIAAAILGLAAKTFNRAVGRASQIDPLPHGFPISSRTPSWAASAT
jgi:ABC-type transport system involved in multi-copper enzyme maturation permease subunit